MKITVKNQEKEILVQTVSLQKNKFDPTNLYLFRCPYCGTAITQIQGLVNKIVAGVEPTENVIVVHQCATCKRLYTFQTLEYPDIRETKVMLVNSLGAMSTFRCYICRTPLVEFRGDKVIRISDMSMVHIPSHIPCPNDGCPGIYYFQDVL
ncbi:MAG: hypothetical protein KGJ89_05340 [Patescibacteria group bacterium]|nr:hypothetical protein [Patescibacteria group bacterium]MDE2015857.1 hypothetical protein [Patescibacteria group bacterium]MDE2227346.1 hypothetical protein [Patescibacteria group bacterium]